MKDPKQARSARTLEKILDACDVLLDHKTFEAISMQEIALEAGVSVGNLYNRFKDKNALVEYITQCHQQAFLGKLKDGIGAQSTDMSVKDRLVYLSTFFHQSLKKLRPMFITLATRAAIEHEPPASAPAATDQIVATATDWLLAQSAELPETVTRQQVEFAIASMAFAMQFDVVYGTPSRMFGERYPERLAEQASIYLLNRGEPS